MLSSHQLLCVKLNASVFTISHSVRVGHGHFHCRQVAFAALPKAAICLSILHSKSVCLYIVKAEKVAVFVTGNWCVCQPCVSSFVCVCVCMCDLSCVYVCSHGVLVQSAIHTFVVYFNPLHALYLQRGIFLTAIIRDMNFTATLCNTYPLTLL